MISVQLATTGPNRGPLLKAVEAYLFEELGFVAISEGHYQLCNDFVNDTRSFESFLGEINKIESKWYPGSQFIWIVIKSDNLSFSVKREGI